MQRIAILLSGRGSNAEAILRACETERWDARVACVVSNRADAKGLELARARGIATAVVDHRAYGDRVAFDAALGDAVAEHAPDAVALAGFMRVLTPVFVDRFADRLFNVHPSLLPAFPGLETHRRAIESGARASGATVHFVTAELDHGPIVLQSVVPIRSDDTTEALAARVLATEHAIYPRALRWFLEGGLVRDGMRVRHRGGEPQLVVAAP